METRRLGRTGHLSSVAILGGAAYSVSNPEETEASFHAALAAGVNHLDIAPQYGDAQRLVGPHVPAVRDRLFVACKTLRTQPDGVRAQLEESLTLLGCDRFDLYQVHALTSLAELDRRAPAFEAIVRARDEGLCSFVGVTGHELETCRAQAEAVRRYDLDTVMFPLSPRLWGDADYRRDATALLDLAAERDLGVMVIKAVSARPWVEGRPRHATTWYEPMTDDAAIARGVAFALSVPGVHAFATPGDVALTARAIAAAATWSPVDLDAAAREVADDALIFPAPFA